MRIIALLVLVLACSQPLDAQRVYTLGAGVDLVGGFDNNPRSGGLSLALRPSNRMEPFYGAYPSISLDILSARSALNMSYAYGWNRTDSQVILLSETHSASVTLTNQFSPRWSTNIRESFSRSDDPQTFYALRGVLPTPEGLTYVFSPVSIDQTSNSNSVSAGVEHTFDARSGLSFGGSHNLRNYSTDGIRGLSDQQDFGANVTFTRRISERTSWNIGYSGAYYDFSQFSEAISHAARFGMSMQVGPNTGFTWSAGASQVSSRSDSGSFGSYEASAGLQQEIRSNLFQLNYTQDNTTPSGIGSLSRNRRASLGFSRALGQSVNVFASASVFDTNAILDNTFDTRGGSATANVGFALTRQLSLQVGGQMQRYTRPVTYQFTQKRVFISLRYSHPNLFRW
jgi:hypothetical protein